MCLDTFLIASRIEIVVFVLFLCSFWGRLIRGSRAGESQLKTTLAWHSRALGGLHRAACCAQAHVFVAPFPRAKRSFGARGALIRFIDAVVALDFVESRQIEHSSRCCSSGDAKRSSITRTAGGREQDVPRRVVVSSSSSIRSSIVTVKPASELLWGVIVCSVGW